MRQDSPTFRGPADRRDDPAHCPGSVGDESVLGPRQPVLTNAGLARGLRLGKTVDQGTKPPSGGLSVGSGTKCGLLSRAFLKQGKTGRGLSFSGASYELRRF